jgi:glycosyltransferase involved in cell wall biosynthesis
MTDESEEHQSFIESEPDKTQRTVLLLTYSFPPRGERTALRSVTVAKTLRLLGWNVIVVCPAPDGTSNRDEGWAQELESLGIVIHRTAPVKRIPLNSDGSVKVSASIVRNSTQWISAWGAVPDTAIAWQKEALQTIGKIMSEQFVNVLYISAPPFSTLAIGSIIANEYSIPFAVDYGDEWLNNPLLSFPTPMHREKARALEESVLKQAELICVPTRTKKEDLLRRNRFLSHEDIAILSHGYDPDDKTTPILSSAQLSPDLHCTITHYADFTEGKTPKYFLSALRQLRQRRPDVVPHLHVRILGLTRTNHKSLVRKWQLADAVHIINIFDRRSALQHCAESDVLWLSEQYDSHAGSVVLGDYLGMGKPILLTSPDGALRKQVQGFTGCYTTDYKNISAISKTLEQIYDDWKSRSLKPPTQEQIQPLNRTEMLRDLSRRLGMAMKI